jgi:hypothetical protein
VDSLHSKHYSHSCCGSFGCGSIHPRWGFCPSQVTFVKLTTCVGEQEAIVEQLDKALLTDEEMLKYDQRWATTADPVNPEVDARKKQKAEA